MQLTQQYLDLYSLRFLDLLNLGIGDIPKTWNAIVPTVIQSRKAYEEIMAHSGLGLLQTMNEGASVTYDAMRVRGKKRFTPIIRTLGVKWTKQSETKDVNGFIKQIGPQLGRSVTASMNLWAANLLTLGSTTRGVKDLDGTALISSSHKVGTTGATASNLISQPLSALALENAIATAKAAPNETGLPFRYYAGGFNLVVPTGLEAVAQRVAQSMKLAGTNDNDENIYNRSMIKNVHCEQLLGFNESALANNWYLVPVSANENPFIYLEVQAPQTTIAPDPDHLGMKMITDMECLFEAKDWRGVVGSIL